MAFPIIKVIKAEHLVTLSSFWWLFRAASLFNNQSIPLQIIINWTLRDPPKAVLHNKPRDIFDFNPPSDHSEQVTTPGVYENTINLN